MNYQILKVMEDKVRKMSEVYADPKPNPIFPKPKSGGKKFLSKLEQAASEVDSSQVEEIEPGVYRWKDNEAIKDLVTQAQQNYVCPHKNLIELGWQETAEGEGLVLGNCLTCGTTRTVDDYTKLEESINGRALYQKRA
jgi:hypothetical protein